MRVTMDDAGVPRLMHVLWLQGMDQAPPLVQDNVRRWAALNPGYTMNVMDGADARKLLAGTRFPVDAMRPQALANIVRMRLLIDFGGVWVDGSLLPVKPLDAWLPEAVAPGGFFAFEKPGPDRPLSNWFLVSRPQHPIVQAWWDESERFWSKPRTLIDGPHPDPVAMVAPAGAAQTDTYPYFWHHYLFRYLLETRPEFAALWHRCTKMSADPPHVLKRRYARRRRPWWPFMLRAAFAPPLHKLDWRVSYPRLLLALLR